MSAGYIQRVDWLEHREALAAAQRAMEEARGVLAQPYWPRDYLPPSVPSVTEDVAGETAKELDAASTTIARTISAW